MKGFGKYAWLFALVALAGILIATPLAAQTTPSNTGGGGSSNLNRLAAPCDFSDQFYADNGIVTGNLIGRFGTSRQFGPPSRSNNQPNWVADHANCSGVDPDRRDFRILATTGGNSDDGNSPFTCASTDPASQPHAPGCATNSAIEPETFEFISILAFLNDQSTFSSTYLRNVGFINGGLEGVQQNPGTDISIGQASLGETAGNTLRGFAMQDIVSNFEAYANIDQFKKSLTCPASATAPFTTQNCKSTPTQFAGQPCSLGMIQNLQNPNATSIPQPCFQVADGTLNGQPFSDVATPNLTQDWRFATNRNAMDGSDGNDPVGALSGSVGNKPFGYFCDDLLGMWIITYFWITQNPQTVTATCAGAYSGISAANGTALDGGPIVLTAYELNDQLEGQLATDGVTPCGAEGQEDPGGGDGGAAWLICPALPDPRAGAITSDAFIDQIFKPNGSPQNIALTANFLSLQIFGVFANELNSRQLAQVEAAAGSVH